MKPLALLLIVLGLLGIIWGGFSFTRKEKIIDLGSVEVRRDKKTSVPIPPLLGLASVGVGLALLTRGKT
jgi:hypothetical protein